MCTKYFIWDVAFTNIEELECNRDRELSYLKEISTTMIRGQVHYLHMALIVRNTAGAVFRDSNKFYINDRPTTRMGKAKEEREL